MRYDINVYWVEDTPMWGKTAKELLELNLAEEGIYADFSMESDAQKAKERIENNCTGFKRYDLLFIDYNISSSDYDGAKLIQDLRNNNIDVDILFYSADREKEIKGMVAKNLSSYEGVYIANRDTFKDKALALLEKNTRRQLSIKSIRGMLMDNTSENDFIVKSYILEKYDDLTDSQKQSVCDAIRQYIVQPQYPSEDKINSFVKKLEENSTIRIKEVLELPNYLVPIELKYIIFNEMVKNIGDVKIDVEKYTQEVVKKRNILAHKKLEICQDLSHIKFCDTLKQYRARKCIERCGQCTDEYTISVEEWNEIRKQTLEFSNSLDAILESLCQKDCK